MGGFFTKLAKAAKLGSEEVGGNQQLQTAESPSAKALVGENEEIDWEKVREDLLAIMDSDSHDDGSFAPVLIRLGWHSCGTYDPEADLKGGSNNAGMRFAPEKNDKENAGLTVARDLLVPIKKKYPQVSYSDLWILAAFCAIEHTGGPKIDFTPGRKDGTEKTSVPPGRLPEAEFGLEPGTDEEGRVNGWENLAQHIRDVFSRMGFNDQETVALICGGHVYGRCHREHSGYSGAWVEAPTQFSNEYAADMIEDEWMCVEHDTKVDGVLIPEETRPAKGKRQYMSKWEPSDDEKAAGKPDPTEMDGKKFVVKYQMMLPSDMVLLWDADFRKHLEKYAEDEELLKEDFGVAFKRLSENGFTGCPFAK